MELTTGNRVVVVRVKGLSLPFSFFYLKSCKEEPKGGLILRLITYKVLDLSNIRECLRFLLCRHVM